MGYMHNLDHAGEHEGWVAMTYADGAVSSGASNSRGHYLEGYVYVDHEIDPAFLRPDEDIVGWLPRCECGWVGVETDRLDGAFEPSGEVEQLLMDQWRLHLRDTLPGAYPRGERLTLVERSR